MSGIVLVVEKAGSLVAPHCAGELEGPLHLVKIDKKGNKEIQFFVFLLSSCVEGEAGYLGLS